MSGAIGGIMKNDTMNSVKDNGKIDPLAFALGPVV